MFGTCAGRFMAGFLAVRAGTAFDPAGWIRIRGGVCYSVQHFKQVSYLRIRLPVVDVLSLPAAGHKTRSSQKHQMLGDRRLARPEGSAQVTDTGFVLSDDIQDRQSQGMLECFEQACLVLEAVHRCPQNIFGNSNAIVSPI